MVKDFCATVTTFNVAIYIFIILNVLMFGKLIDVLNVLNVGKLKCSCPTVKDFCANITTLQHLTLQLYNHPTFFNLF